MAITDIDPNNFNETFDAYYKSLESDPVPGMDIPAINFKDAPVPFMLRQNNPAVFDPATNIKNFVQNIPGNVSTGFDKSLDLGKAAFGGIASLVTGVPGIGLLLNTFRETPEQELLKDFYGQQFGLDDIGRVRSGIMAGYNPVSMFGPQGLTSAIDKRMATIRNTLSKKKSVALENRLKELQRIKDAEQKAREDKAREIRAQIEQQYRDSPGQFGGSDRQTEREQAGPGYSDVSEAGSF